MTVSGSTCGSNSSCSLPVVGIYNVEQRSAASTLTLGRPHSYPLACKRSPPPHPASLNSRVLVGALSLRCDSCFYPDPDKIGTGVSAYPFERVAKMTLGVVPKNACHDRSSHRRRVSAVRTVSRPRAARTLTHEPSTGSPAVDAGDPKFTPPPFYDQRGPDFFRVRNGRIDIGSFEAQAGSTPTPTPRPAPTARPRRAPHPRPTPP